MSEENEVTNRNKYYGWFKERLVRQYLLWSAVYVMITRKVSFAKAQGMVSYEYWKKCMDTGEANILYRPADSSIGEIGPQRRTEGSVDWWLLVIIAMVLYRLYKKYKK